jgi:fused signal recognition particle receptor
VTLREHEGEKPSQQTAPQVSSEKGASFWKRMLDKTTRLFQTEAVSEAEEVEALEEALLRADVSSVLVDELLECAQRQPNGPARRSAIEAHLNCLFPNGASNNTSSIRFMDAPGPHVLMLVGVNGSGKTTTIAKLTHTFREQGRPVFIIGADTYRAAADAQLTAWCERLGVTYVTSQTLISATDASPFAAASRMHPARVVSDALQQFHKEAALPESAVILVDTSGRLHVDAPLMEELAKVQRSLIKTLETLHLPTATLHPLFILDATTGQNALKQVTAFHECLGLSGFILTKLDASSRGGTVFGMVRETQVFPLFLTSGETLDAIQPFDAQAFTHAFCQALPLT